jgi:hypothetical protein
MAQKKAAARRTSHRKQASSSRAPVAKKQQNARAAASWTDRVENTAGKVAETAKETFEGAKDKLADVIQSAKSALK